MDALVGDTVGKIGPALFDAAFRMGMQRQVLGFEGWRYLNQRIKRRVVERIIMERKSVTSERREEHLGKTAGQACWSVYRLSSKDLEA